MKVLGKLSLAAMAALVLLAFASCGGNDVSAGLQGGSGEKISVIADGATDYIIVRSDTAGESEVKCATALRRGLTDQTGVTLSIETDWVGKGASVPQGTKEILVGGTNRPESDAAMQVLSNRVNNGRDYAIVVKNGRIAIVGGSDEALLQAVEYFLANYVSKDGCEIADNENYFYEHEYPNVKIAGNDLFLYHIVYQENGSYLNRLAAVALSECIEREIGYSLPVQPDSEPETEYEILIGQTSRTESSKAKEAAGELSSSEFFAQVTGKKLPLIGGSAWAMEYGAHELAALFTGESADLGDGAKWSGDYLQLAAGKYEPKQSPVQGADLSAFQTVEPAGDAYYIVDDDSFFKFGGLVSGWDYDGRGGAKGPYERDPSVLDDISAQEPTAFTRELTKQTQGNLTLETIFSYSGAKSGLTYQVRNDRDQIAVDLQVEDGKFVVSLADGSVKEVCLAPVGANHRIKVLLDLDARKYELIINNLSYGNFDFKDSCDYINVLELSTSREAVMKVTPSVTKAYMNYLVNERFLMVDESLYPYDWTFTGDKDAKAVAKATNYNEGGIADVNSLDIWGKEVTVAKSFTPVNGNVAFEMKFFLPERADGVRFVLAKGQDAVVSVRTDGLSLYSGNDDLLKAYYSANVWQTLRIEADTRTQTARIKLNGKDLKTVYFESLADSFDNLMVLINGETQAHLMIDDIFVCQLQEYSDYVPEPLSANENEAIVGINICSLWRNGTHWGWDVISPYDEIKPYLGYYEDGSPEVMDWEIKWMTEHGIDFQLFCWYAANGNAPMKSTHLSQALMNGYFNAKYSDKMDFALLWEASNGARPASADDFRSYLVPYWVDYFLSDDRYMRIDNKAVIAVFGAEKLIEAFGGQAQCKTEFDYLSEVCRELGYDGAIFLACNSSTDSNALKFLNNAGFDGVYAYNWGKSGSDAEFTKNIISTQQSKNAIHVVPTLSTGFNNVGWAGTRSPNMEVDDYEDTLTWIKDTALKKYDEDSWKSKFLMLSTWNEYGEGTYIMPSGLNGFGYVDAIRKVYGNTDVEHTDVRPTDAQIARLSHLYPQNRSFLRPLYRTLLPIPETAVKTWTFENSSNPTWVAGFSVDNFKCADGVISGSSTKNDFAVVTADQNLSIDLTNVTYVHLRMKTNIDSEAELFFLTDGDSQWDGNKRSSVSVTKGEMNDYYIPVYQSSSWKGTLKALRIDPLVAPGTFEIECIELLADDNAFDLTVDGVKVVLGEYPAENVDGTVYVPLEPRSGIFNMLSCAYRWDKQTKTVTFIASDPTAPRDLEISLTVGKPFALVDGKEVALEQAVQEMDGLPVVPINLIADTLGYRMEFLDHQVNLVTETGMKE